MRRNNAARMVSRSKEQRRRYHERKWQEDKSEETCRQSAGTYHDGDTVGITYHGPAENICGIHGKKIQNNI